MAEIIKPGILDHKPKRKLNIGVSDIIIFSIMLIIIVALAITLVSKLQLKHDVSNARTISDKVITDIAKRDGSALRRLGDAKFQSMYTADQLTKQLNSIKLVTDGTATVDKQIVSHGKSGKTVFIVYKYPPKLAKQPYFISVSVSPDKNDVWHLTHLGGSANESTAIAG
jgi:hypothetical protein